MQKGFLKCLDIQNTEVNKLDLTTIVINLGKIRG